MLLPLIVDPATLQAALTAEASAGAPSGAPRIRLVDVRSEEHHDGGHIPGALRLDGARLNHRQPPVGGLLPDADSVNALLRDLGIGIGDHIVAFDNGAETPAARLIWVLHAYGVQATSWLDGGMHAWRAAGLPQAQVRSAPVEPGDLRVATAREHVVDVDTLLAELDDPALLPLDTRSEAEFLGTDVRSQFGGHVPGAVHANWQDLLRVDCTLKPLAEIGAQFESLGLTPARRIVVYCQTHQRSAVSYLVLRALGYPDVRALDGAWSNWGNRADTPKATGTA